MADQPRTFYRYRVVNATTLRDLYYDTIHFAHPGSFNDPLDCKPTLDCDSDNEDLRKILGFLLKERIGSEIRSHLIKAGLQGYHATDHAKKRACSEVEMQLAGIAYYATNPDYDTKNVEDNESRLLVNTIEEELLRSYARGICCFSTSYSNPVLWSHYADQHQGICIGYSTDRKLVPQLQEVVYEGRRAIKTSALIDAFLNKDEQAVAALDRDILFRKAPDWEYEREWRLIGLKGLKPSPLRLTEITFGLRCSWAVQYSVVKMLEDRKNKVEFYNIHGNMDKYDLHRQNLDLDEFQAAPPRAAEVLDELLNT
ncbi:MAG: DUF2971 domain-containing protein [Desulfobulbus sp.]|nr:DUF2971 domain-containing protein [Desulfobulbus sp.]